MRVLLALGSNLGDRLSKLKDGVHAMAADVVFDRASTVYETRPVGLHDQPDFLNAVVSGRTTLSPTDLLARLQVVEYDAGRQRTVVNGPRPLDIDILFFGAKTIRTPSLTIPHPRWSDRAFVRVPLLEIDPDRIDPVTGKRLSDVCRGKGRNGVRVFAERTVLEVEF